VTKRARVWMVGWKNQSGKCGLYPGQPGNYLKRDAIAECHDWKMAGRNYATVMEVFIEYDDRTPRKRAKKKAK